MSQAWSIGGDQRADVIARVAASISGLALSRGQEIPDGPARETAAAIEKKAYTAAQVHTIRLISIFLIPLMAMHLGQSMRIIFSPTFLRSDHPRLTTHGTLVPARPLSPSRRMQGNISPSVTAFRLQRLSSCPLVAHDLNPPNHPGSSQEAGRAPSRGCEYRSAGPAACRTRGGGLRSHGVGECGLLSFSIKMIEINDQRWLTSAAAAPRSAPRFLT